MTALDVPTAPPGDLWEMAARAFDPTTVGDPLWTPQPKQALATALAEKADEVLFGGEVGGGKTEWLLGYLGEEMERHPSNRGVIFRRVYPSLARSVIPRAKDLYAGRARWNGNDSTFTWPNGSVLQMSHLQHADSVRDHQGAEYGVIAFEELTEFLLSQYEFMLSRLRAPADGIRPHAIATTNPGGVGHAWVKRRWITPKVTDVPDGTPLPEPFDRWRPAPSDANPDPGVRVFVPSSLDDNPALSRRDPGYRSRLLSAITDPGLRAALTTGDWDAIDAVQGALWQRSWLESGRRAHVRAIDRVRTVVAVDPSDGDEATSDEYGVSAASMTTSGAVAVTYSGGWFGSPRDLAKRTIELYHDLGADALVVERNHGGKWMPAVLRNVDQYANIQTVWASTGKRVRAEPVAALFEPDPDARLRHRAYLVGHHEDLEEELTHFTGAPGSVSPNRLDAMVWAIHALVFERRVATTSQVSDERLRGRR